MRIFKSKITKCADCGVTFEGKGTYCSHCVTKMMTPIKPESYNRSEEEAYREVVNRRRSNPPIVIATDNSTEEEIAENMGLNWYGPYYWAWSTKSRRAVNISKKDYESQGRQISTIIDKIDAPYQGSDVTVQIILLCQTESALPAFEMAIITSGHIEVVGNYTEYNKARQDFDRTYRTITQSMRTERTANIEYEEEQTRLKKDREDRTLEENRTTVKKEEKPTCTRKIQWEE